MIDILLIKCTIDKSKKVTVSIELLIMNKEA